MKGKGLWILTAFNILMFALYLVGCASNSDGQAQGAVSSNYDWAYPKSISWYGDPGGITWENPRHVKYEDRTFIRITAQDGTPFLIYGQTVAKGEKK
jgi:hypothetical protein